MMPTDGKAGETFWKRGNLRRQNRTRCYSTKNNDKYTYKSEPFTLTISLFTFTRVFTIPRYKRQTTFLSVLQTFSLSSTHPLLHFSLLSRNFLFIFKRSPLSLMCATAFYYFSPPFLPFFHI